MTWRLEVADLSTGYNSFAINKISFSLKSGDILGIVGKSGCGKSTIIKTLLGLKKPVSGSITTFKNNEKVALDSVIGYSPQENALFLSLSITENCKTFADLHGVQYVDFKDRELNLLKTLGLEASKNKLITELSGGMQKRADLAATLIHDPQVIILDEPFNGLDIGIQFFIWSFLKQLAKQGKIIIISSHLLEDIDTNCTHLGLIHEGTYYDDAAVHKFLKDSRMSLTQYARGLFR